MPKHNYPGFGQYDDDYQDAGFNIAAFVADFSSISTLQDLLVDPQLGSHSGIGDAQLCTSQSLPLTMSDFHSVGCLCNHSHIWGHLHQGTHSSWTDPITSQSTPGLAGTMGSSLYHSGQSPVWATNLFDQPLLQGSLEGSIELQPTWAAPQSSGSVASELDDYFSIIIPQSTGSGAISPAIQAFNGLSLTEDFVLNYDKIHLNPFGTLVDNLNTTRLQDHDSSAYSISNCEPFVAASVVPPQDGSLSPLSTSRQQSPAPSPKTQTRLGQDKEEEWRPLKCTFEGCTSKAVFARRCDLAKHYRQHFRKYRCRIEGCQATSAVFAAKKDRTRHENAHSPSILCEQCGRKFSRRDNLKDHVRRRH